MGSDAITPKPQEQNGNTDLQTWAGFAHVGPLSRSPPLIQHAFRPAQCHGRATGSHKGRSPLGVYMSIGSTEIVACRHLAGGLSGNRSAGALSAHRLLLRTTAPSFINASPWQSISSPLAHAHDHTQGTFSIAHLARILAILTFSPPRRCLRPAPIGLFPCFHAVSIGVFWMETAEPQQIRGPPPLCFHVSI